MPGPAGRPASFKPCRARPLPIQEMASVIGTTMGTREGVTSTDILVVGGGVTGAFCAWLLALEGHSVSVVDDGNRAGAGSRNNPGGLNPLHGPGIPGSTASIAREALAMHLQHAPRIGELCGRDITLRPVVRYELALNEHEALALQATHALYEATEGFASASLTADEFRHIEPMASAAVQAVLRLEGNYLVDSAAYTESILAAAGALGVRRIHATVHGFLEDQDRVHGVMTDEGRLNAGHFVLAAGSWVGGLVAPLGVSLPIKPVKGQLLKVRHAERRHANHHVSRGGTGIYVSAPGEFLIGGTQEDAGFDIEATLSGREELWRQAEQLIPGIRSAELCAQPVGYRPTAPDLQPVVGTLPAHPNIHVAGGGWSKGMLLAPMLAKAVVGAICGANDEEIPPLMHLARLLPSS